jgi:L-seryl-tRNA(Ser) seleniumtransferase
LHTNLGRAPLSGEAINAAMAAAAYSDLELDIATGERGSRQSRVQGLLRALTGAEAATVTVNAAAGMLLVLAALTRGKEVIVSRGQAVEIGGGFRIPGVLRQSGARLVEVGTTNRTRILDYEEAITGRTAALLHVHASNFRVVGFTEQVSLRSLAGLAHDRGLLLIDDNGSGALLDTAQFGLAHEPMPVESLQAGSDVVVFSGDKLLGGPQAGIVIGGAEPLRRITRQPLARAVRPDKLTLAALSATLLSYIRGDALETLPLWRMIAASEATISARARRMAASLQESGIEAVLVPGKSTIGGGSLPTEVLPTVLIALPKFSAAALRASDPPVIGRTQEGRVVLDLRTVPESQEGALLDSIRQVKRRAKSPKNTVLDSTAR